MDVDLTHELVKAIFEYKDGNLYWKTKMTPKSSKGQIAGCYDGKGYLKIGLFSRVYRAHQLIFFWHHGYFPAYIDHIDGNGLNNRIENLRSCSHSQNMRNRVGTKNSKSIYKGVSCNRNRWRARIKIEGKEKHLGTFDTEIEAAQAYNIAALEAFGKFAYVNPIENYSGK